MIHCSYKSICFTEAKNNITWIILLHCQVDIFIDTLFTIQNILISDTLESILMLSWTWTVYRKPSFSNNQLAFYCSECQCGLNLMGFLVHYLWSDLTEQQKKKELKHLSRSVIYINIYIYIYIYILYIYIAIG